MSGATTTILLPKVAADGDDGARARRLSIALGATLFVSIVLNGLLAAACPVLIPLLFGRHFAPAVGVAVVLCLSQVVQSGIRVLAVGLRGYGDWRSGTIAMAVNLAVFLVLTSAAIGPLGLMGVGLGLLAGNLAGAAFILHRAMARTGLPLARFLVPPRWMFSPATLRSRLARAHAG